MDIIIPVGHFKLDILGDAVRYFEHITFFLIIHGKHRTHWQRLQTSDSANVMVNRLGLGLEWLGLTA
jgi:hypothetical protein